MSDNKELDDFIKMFEKEHMFVCKKLKSVARAANALYDAGIWSCDRPISESAEAAMWEQLRDALGRTPGFGPKPFKDD